MLVSRNPFSGPEVRRNHECHRQKCVRVSNVNTVIGPRVLEHLSPPPEQ